MKKTFIADIENGKMIIMEPEVMKEFISKKDGMVFVTLSRVGKPRSLEQNKYYWGVIVALMCEYMGHNNKILEEIQTVHKYITSENLSKKIHIQLPDEKPQEITVIQSTSDLTTIEFEGFMERTRTWASIRHSVNIPEPNECSDRFSEYNYNQKELKKRV